MPKANAYGDTGSIFGNFLNDLKRIPEQSIHASRQERMHGRQADYGKVIQRQAEIDRETRQLAQGAEPYGGPVLNPDGSVNRLQTAMKIRRQELLQDAIKRQADTDYGVDLKTATEAKGAGVAAPAPKGIADRIQEGLGLNEDQTAGQKLVGAEPGQSMGRALLGKAIGGNDVPLERQITLAQQDDAATKAGKVAAATAPYENSWTQGDNYALNGQPVGRAARNLRTGEYGIMGQDGKLQPIPEGATPMTPSTMNKNIVDAKTFKQFKTDLTDAERSLRQFERYADSVGGMDKGVAGLADKFALGMKSLFSSGELKPDELARAAASGQLQGLLGGNRISVVGGGVMTEQDAQRIVQRLGGDVGALQNPQVVMKALGELYQDRFAQYEDDKNFYNEAVDSYWGSKGFKKAADTTFNKLFGAPAVNGNVDQPAQTSVDDLIKKYSQ